MSFTILKTFLTKSNLGMLNEIELRFNYSYSNLNAGNSIFVCKSAKKVSSGWCVVYCGSEPLAACHLSQWAGGGVVGTSAVIQWCDQVKVCHRRRVIDRLIVAGNGHDLSSGTSGRLDLSRTTQPWATASQQNSTAIAFEVWSRIYNEWSVARAAFYELPITSICLHCSFNDRQICNQIAYLPATRARWCWMSRINCI